MTTGTERTLPPMGALAIMAHSLAVKRLGYDGMFLRNKDGSQHPGFDRSGRFGRRRYWEECDPLSSTTAEYYHIIRRLERGEQP
jgi:hypothetical protein